MKITIYILLTFLMVFAIACDRADDPVPPKHDPIGNPDPDPKPEPENQAPGAFTLLEIIDKDTGVTLLPTFKWNTSTDPDGQMVGYSFLLGTDTGTWDTLATQLNTATFSIDENLKRFTEYYWKVNAKDPLGLETSSDTLSFTTRNVNSPLLPINPSAGFSPRMLHTVAFFKNRLWLIGGADQDKNLGDIWLSNDGLTWDYGNILGINSRGHTATVFRDTLWVINGRTNQNIITRHNGMTAFTEIQTEAYVCEAPWTGREMHTSAVFKDHLYVMGGVDSNDQPLNEVWSATEICIWNDDAGVTADWSARFGHSSIVFDDKLWVIGGYDGDDYLNDVWYTEDGINWNKVVQENPFPKRISHQSVVFDNKIWIFGGNDGPVAKNDIWYSEDGSTWTALMEDVAYGGRIRPTVTVFDDKMLLIGGSDLQNYHNDVWVFN